MKDLSRKQLIKLVEKIKNAQGTEKEIDDMIALLGRNVPDPEVTDLIFWNEENLTSEQIVDKALSYKPIIL